MQEIHILLVDDNEGDILLTREALEEAKIVNRISVAYDGMEAIRFLRGASPFTHRDTPDLILLDINLPKMDGKEVLGIIKSDPELRKVPIVMLTSSREERDLARSYGLGGNAYVVKPVAFPDFVAALKELGLFWAVINQPPPGSMKRAV